MRFYLPKWSRTALFHFKAKVQRQPVVEHRINNPYHAVSIIPGPYPCDAVLRIGNRRFLSHEAPIPPLDARCAGCGCRFKHHKDRRAGPRRRSDQGMRVLFDGNDRRRAGGRRAEDSE